jgi:hypothetical protein
MVFQIDDDVLESLLSCVLCNRIGQSYRELLDLGLSPMTVVVLELFRFDTKNRGW